MRNPRNMYAEFLIIAPERYRTEIKDMDTLGAESFASYVQDKTYVMK